jgi:hypothetical protein
MHLNFLLSQRGTSSPFTEEVLLRNLEQDFNFSVYANLLEFNVKNRYLIRIRKGFARFTANITQVGDKVVLLSGALCPYILHLTGLGTYWLVGHADIHGIMFGEAHERWMRGIA